MPSSSTILTILGGCFILHSAYSCLQYRSLIAELDLMTTTTMGTTGTSLPFDVIAEIGLGFFFSLVGQLSGSGKLQDISGFKSSQSLVAPAYQTRDFDIYSNRANALALKMK
mmetsp:Transcript_18522/g.26160  ORF Transcript_18522/g.26160 Transcript_18522/m.26160 type:complete len:112 (+) Transcript_18522:266-601(+)